MSGIKLDLKVFKAGLLPVVGSSYQNSYSYLCTKYEYEQKNGQVRVRVRENETGQVRVRKYEQFSKFQPLVIASTHSNIHSSYFSSLYIFMVFIRVAFEGGGVGFRGLPGQSLRVGFLPKKQSQFGGRCSLVFIIVLSIRIVVSTILHIILEFNRYLWLYLKSIYQDSIQFLWKTC